jgi:hypothetical protein
MNNFIDPNLLDPICNTGLLNPALFPVGSAQHLDPNFNILPFLCDLLKATTDNNASPLLTNPPSGFDLTPFTDFSMLTAVGDPRASLGDVMTQTYINFLPRVIVQNEVRQNGGVQVIDNYICDADGVPIKNLLTGPVLLSMDLTGQKSYKYGAITVPPVSANYQDLMKPLESSEVTQFVQDYVTGKKNESAQSFAFFIEQYLPDWTPSGIAVYDRNGYLILSLTKGVSTAYVKYYSDVANSVGCYLQQTSITHYLTYQTSDSLALSNAESLTIPDYTALMQNDTDATNFKNQILTYCVTSPDQKYSNLYTNDAALSAYVMDIVNAHFGVQTNTDTATQAVSAVTC